MHVWIQRKGLEEFTPLAQACGYYTISESGTWNFISGTTITHSNQMHTSNTDCDFDLDNAGFTSKTLLSNLFSPFFLFVVTFSQQKSVNITVPSAKRRSRRLRRSPEK